METTLRILLNIWDIPSGNGMIRPGSLSKLLSQELPVKTAYRLGRFYNKVKSEMQQYFLLREKLIRKYGNEEKGIFSIQPADGGAWEKFSAENEELLSTKVKLDYDPIDIEEIESLKISPIDISNLEPLFRIENDKKNNPEKKTKIKKQT